MARYFLEFAYEGSAFCGWQRQPHLSNSVQQTLEEALTVLYRQPVELVGSSRTDAGVHACQNFAHWDADTLPHMLAVKLNGLLPYQLGVRGIWAAGPDMPDGRQPHSRFDATGRSYVYRIARQRSPLHQGRASPIFYPLHFEQMQAAAQLLLGFSDFASFCKAQSNAKTTICHLEYAYWVKTQEYGVEIWEFHVKANRFLRGMVRALVGTMLLVGKGMLSLDALQAAVHGRDRRLVGPNAQAWGLYLAQVHYPEGWLQRLA